MELRHLRYFVAVAQDLSIRRAAERLHIAAPPLSQQIKNLEQDIGAQLFARVGRGRHIKLTEAGRLFLEHARKILQDVNRGTALARQAANGEVGHLSIGYSAPAEFRVFPQIVPAFQRRWPLIHLDFHPLGVAQQLEKLRRDELDVGFAWLPLPTAEFDVVPISAEPLIAVLPAKHRLARARKIAIKDLTGERLVLFPRELFSDAYHQIEQLFLMSGARMIVAHELETPLSVLNFVAMGVGCSVLPEYVRLIKHDGVVCKLLQPPTLVKRLAMIKRKDRGNQPDSFFQFTVRELGAKSR